jgi:hypothetical protein
MFSEKIVEEHTLEHCHSFTHCYSYHNPFPLFSIPAKLSPRQRHDSSKLAMRTHWQLLNILSHIDPFLGNARNNRKGIVRSVFYVVRVMSIARQRVVKHISAEATPRGIIGHLIAWQRRGKQALSTIQDVFSMDPHRDYKSCPIVNQKRVLRHRLLHYPALTDVPVYSRTLCQFVFCE